MPGMEETRQHSLRILREPEVRLRTGLSASERLALEARDQFPERVPLGVRAVGWLEHEVNAWIQGRASLRDDAARAEAERVARMPPAVRHKWRMEHEGSDDAPA
jgi:prophage regulatory protein